MPAAKTPYPLWNVATNVPAGTLQSAPVISFSVDVRTLYGAEILWRIVNSGALTAYCVIQFQISSDGSDWYDYQLVASKDLLSGTVTNGPTVKLTKDAAYIRAIAYGNLNSACTVQASISATSSL